MASTEREREGERERQRGRQTSPLKLNSLSVRLPTSIMIISNHGWQSTGKLHPSCDQDECSSAQDEFSSRCVYPSLVWDDVIRFIARYSSLCLQISQDSVHFESCCLFLFLCQPFCRCRCPCCRCPRFGNFRSGSVAGATHVSPLLSLSRLCSPVSGPTVVFPDFRSDLPGPTLQCFVKPSRVGDFKDC